MARVERQPGTQVPRLNRSGQSQRFLEKPSTRIGIALSVAALAAAGIGAKIGLGRNSGSSPLATETPAAATPIIPQPNEGARLSTPTPMETATPKLTTAPTEIDTQNPQEKIDTIIKLQNDALAKGEVKIPQSQAFIDAGGRVEQSNPMPNGEIDLFLIAPQGKDIVIPALIGGKVISAKRVNSSTNMITIQVGIKTFGMLFPRTSELLVQKGDDVSVDTPVSKVSYDPNSDIQVLFEANGAYTPPGTIALLGLQDANGTFQQLTLNSMLRDAAGKVLTIPTLIK